MPYPCLSAAFFARDDRSLAVPASAPASGAARTSAFFHGTGFIDYQGPAHKLLSITGFDRVLDIRILHFSKAKSSGFVRKPVAHYTYGTGVNSLLLEPRSQICFGCAVGKIANI